MHLSDLFREFRRSEPTILLGLKSFIMIMLIAGLIGYLAIIIIDVKQDAPIIMTSFAEVDAIRAPNIVVNSYSKFSLDCIDTYITLGTLNNITALCSQYLTQPDYKLGPTQTYWGTFLPSKDVLFNKPNKSNNYTSLFAIYLTLKIIDGDPNLGFSITAMDPDYDVYSPYIQEKKFDELLSLDLPISPYNDSIVGMNSYGGLMPNQGYQFLFSRTIKEKIKSGLMTDFGIPTYERTSYLSSSLLGSPLPAPPDGLTNANKTVVLIHLKNPHPSVQVEREVRSRTFLGGIGLIGGAWGLATLLYGFLFGTDTLRPWGAVQSYCCGFSHVTRTKLRKSLPIIPFFDASNPDNRTKPLMKNLSPSEQIELLQLRVDSLELFLQEYVVDVRYLDEIRDKASPSFTPNSTLNSIEDTTEITQRKDLMNDPPNSTTTTLDNFPPQSTSSNYTDTTLA